jgi:hypothetical protein
MYITERLDKIASSLEEQGYLKEAYELDKISNTLDLIFKEAWSGKHSPQYLVLENIKRALKMKNTEIALNLLENSIKSKDMFLRLYGDYKTEDNKQPAQEYADAYTNTIELTKKGDIERAIKEIERAQQALIDLEPIITERQTRAPQKKPPLQTSEMIFSEGKRPIIKNPGDDLFFGPGQKIPKRKPLLE